MFTSAKSKKAAFLFLSVCLAGLAFFRVSVRDKHNLPAAKTAEIVASHRAELTLRAADAINILPAFEINNKTDAEHADDEFVNKLKVDKAAVLSSEVENTLQSLAQQEDGNNLALLAKIIILKTELDEKTEEDLKHFDLVGKKSTQTSQIRALLSDFSTLYNQDNVKGLTKTKWACLDANVFSQNNFLGNGWFKERALLRFYQFSGKSAQYRAEIKSIKNESWNFIIKLAVLGAGIGLLGFTGLVIIIWQLCFARRSSSMNNAIKEPITNVKYSWSSVLLVFYAWFCTQLFFGLLMGWLKQHHLVNVYGASNTLKVSIIVALIYLLSNGPVLAYIYMFALRPQNIPFLQGINWRLKSGNKGIYKLIAIALLAWIAAIPLVTFSYLVSVKLFSASGSSNPIIAIVMEAAGTDSIMTILLFYATLGIMAPLVEESLFRGFFYTFLRSRYGPVVSNIASAGLFSAAHLDPGAFLPLFCLGSIFAYLFEITGSIVSPVIAHGLWNSGTFTLVLILFGT